MRPAAGSASTGGSAFDAMIQLTPLAFQVDVGAALALRYHGRLLMGVSLSGSLAGPTPWQVQGKASIKFCSSRCRYPSRDIREQDRATAAGGGGCGGQVAAAVADRRNWSGAVPREQEPPVVTVRDGAAPTDHDCGCIHWRS